MLVELTEEQCRAAMAAGDFAEDVIASAPQVAVILTQGWCPEWRVMSQLIKPQESYSEAKVYFVEYDRKPWFEEFMNFKERTYRNEFVPYVRYYSAGTLVGDSNFVGPDQFWQFFA